MQGTNEITNFSLKNKKGAKVGTFLLQI